MKPKQILICILYTIVMLTIVGYFLYRAVKYGDLTDFAMLGISFFLACYVECGAVRNLTAVVAAEFSGYRLRLEMAGGRQIDLELEEIKSLKRRQMCYILKTEGGKSYRIHHNVKVQRGGRTYTGFAGNEFPGVEIKNIVGGGMSRLGIGFSLFMCVYFGMGIFYAKQSAGMSSEESGIYVLNVFMAIGIILAWRAFHEVIKVTIIGEDVYFTLLSGRVKQRKKSDIRKIVKRDESVQIIMKRGRFHGLEDKKLVIVNGEAMYNGLRGHEFPGVEIIDKVKTEAEK